jgi:hypothetical protein
MEWIVFIVIIFPPKTKKVIISMFVATTAPWDIQNITRDASLEKNTIQKKQE